MKKIMFVNRSKKNCGIIDYGIRLHNIIKKSKKFLVYFSEVENADEFVHSYNYIKPDLILYNYYPTVLPFIDDNLLSNIRHIPHVVIHHELWTKFTPNGVLVVDSTSPDFESNNIYSLPRPLFENVEFKDRKTYPYPVIGSFGFGFQDKNFPRIADLVCQQFDKAIIRLNIPFATFGDESGHLAYKEVDKITDVIAKTNKNIQLICTHDFLNHSEMLEFLHNNDVNIFLYDKHSDRSLSSTIDYALSVKKPIAISDSWMFRHINNVEPSIIVDNTPINDIISNGIEPLKPIYEKYSNESLINKFEYAISKILNIV